jgi:nitric oxide dioxygenase
MERIAQRHCALGIRSVQYTVVGRYLLGAVNTVLGDAVTPQIAAAWDEVYWLFAARLIGREARIYAEAGADEAHPWREYVVASRVTEAHDTVSFILTPADGRPAPRFLPGQYITVAADLPDGTRQLRQYSLSQAAAGTSPPCMPTAASGSSRNNLYGLGAGPFVGCFFGCTV